VTRKPVHFVLGDFIYFSEVLILVSCGHKLNEFKLREGARKHREIWQNRSRAAISETFREEHIRAQSIGKASFIFS
jgi:hypothetical protein